MKTMELLKRLLYLGARVSKMLLLCFSWLSMTVGAAAVVVGSFIHFGLLDAVWSSGQAALAGSGIKRTMGFIASLNMTMLHVGVSLLILAITSRYFALTGYGSSKREQVGE